MTISRSLSPAAKETIARCFSRAASLAWEAGENLIYPQTPPSQETPPRRHPTSAIFNKRKVRVANYDGDNMFRIIDIDDRH